MSLFSFKGSSERIGTIIDIGSGSVLVAIVHSKDAEASPAIIWSHREHAPLKNIDSLEQSAKTVMTALVNALLRFDVEGRRALHEYSKSARIDTVQCSIGAPWSYTVTKNIHYSQDEPFPITESLIDELLRTALQQVENEIGGQETTSKHGLSVIARTTMDILSNGYRVAHPEGQKANALDISHTTVVTQQYLLDAISDLQQKLFSSAVVDKLSYILILFCVSQDMYRGTFDTCLVHVSYEATEIGIVRNGVLTYTTHTPFGSFSIAREIANITGVPLYEAFQYLHSEDPFAFIESLPNSQKGEIGKVFESYIARITDLFHETGDELSIPKNILLHADLESEPFFKDIIEKAAKRRLKVDPFVQMVTPKLISKDTHKDKQKHQSDTAMLVSAQFFHKRNHCSNFEYL